MLPIAVKAGFVGLFVVKKLAVSIDPIAGLDEILRKRDHIFGAVAPDVVVGVYAGSSGPQSCHEAGSRRITHWSLAVGPAEAHPPPGEAIEVRCDSLGMPTENADPVIQIVDGKEEHI